MPEGPSGILAGKGPSSKPCLLCKHWIAIPTFQSPQLICLPACAEISQMTAERKDELMEDMQLSSSELSRSRCIIRDCNAFFDILHRPDQMAKSFGLKIPEKQTNHLTGFTRSSVLHNSSSFLQRQCHTILVIVGLQHRKPCEGLAVCLLYKD